ncbi:hypothetical protein DM02DRAFT_618020 [Periconia macrospinosa]|uniref:Rhodopsin domain-containing protein n=1 Tax=Periconia macrospinosa TaxID=97972 RepID=A0A2V1DAZ1_9PLEO|nr:hypothetical protein DM02DRAFT_618020 [Periconia macrospinosa]
MDLTTTNAISQFNTYAVWLYIIAGTCYRLALLALYGRLFTVPHTTRYLVRIGFVVIICFNTTVLFVIVFICVPPSYVWDVAHAAEGPGGSQNCRDVRPWAYVNGAMNVVEDAYVLLLPLPVVWGMKMRWARKARVLGVFGVGVLGLVASVIRLVETRLLVNSTDWTRAFSELGFWGVIEVNVAIFCACMTTVPAFLQKYWPQVAGLFNSTRLDTITGKSNRQTQGSSQHHHHQRHVRVEGGFDNSSNEHLTSPQQFALGNITITRDVEVELETIGAGKRERRVEGV